MYIGDHDSLGLATMLFEAVGNSLDEALAGRATRVAVQVADDDTVTVEDDGAGLPLEATICGLPAIPAIFLNLHTSPTLDGHPQHIHVRPGLAGVGIAVVQALSARFDVETVRGGLLHRVGFTNGELSSPVTCLGPTTRRGTRLTWSPDRSVFRRAKHNLLALEAVLAPVGAFLPNVELLWQGRSLRRPRGLVEWVEQLAPAALAETSWTTEGEAFDVRVQVALAWEPARRERLLRAFVNCAEMTEAGSHVVGLLDAVKETAPTKRLAAKALAGLVGVVHVWMLHPRFRGPVRAALDVETARFAVRDVVSAALRKTPWWDRLATEVDGAK
jgi:DNA gyrase subunit B